MTKEIMREGKGNKGREK